MSAKNMSGFYAVNDRPVKFVPTPDGGLDVQVLNMRTGAFERDMSYLSKVFDAGKDVDWLTEEAFDARVAEILRELDSPPT